MNKPTIEEILAPKPQAQPRIYAYAIHDAACGIRIRPPFQGWRFWVPKALPWANISRPIGALTANSANGATQLSTIPLTHWANISRPVGALTANSANGAAHSQPRATPWVTNSQNPFSPERAT